jgi:hypothetical protein
MRLLLDESLPKKLKARLAPHEVRTVPEMGWAGKTNGELLRLAEQEFDVMGSTSDLRRVGWPMLAGIMAKTALSPSLSRAHIVRHHKPGRACVLCDPRPDR